MSLFSRIQSWFKVPQGTKLVITNEGKIKTNVISKEGIISSNFICGIEIFNDNSTPAEFVVSILVDRFGMKKSDATTAMLICHSNESVLIELDTNENAEEIVQLVNADAQNHSYPLVCKVVTAQQDAPADAKSGAAEQ